jgi:hypothetical protein
MHMRIDELITFKKNPLHDMIKSMEVGYDLEGIVTASGLHKELISRGFKKIGSGSFSVVYEHPSYPWIFKLFREDPAYMWYLNYALEHQDDPHVPRIKGRFMQLQTDGGRLYLVRLEKLKTRNTHPSIKAAQRYIAALERKKSDDSLSRFPNLAQSIDDINSSKPRRYNWDIGKNNIMFRGSTPVLNDPLAY